MDLAERVEQLERRSKILTALLVLALVGTVTAGFTGKEGTLGTLRVRELIVVDENGRERVWIAAPVPHRPEELDEIGGEPRVAGIMILDQEGREQSLYGIDDKPRGKLFRGHAFVVGAEVVH